MAKIKNISKQPVTLNIGDQNVRIMPRKTIEVAEKLVAGNKQITNLKHTGILKVTK